jgi:hypothetical protein
MTAATFNPNHEILQTPVFNVVLHYSNWNLYKSNLSTGRVSTSPERFVGQSLKALLYVSGWNARGDTSYVTEGKDMYNKGLLKGKFTKAKAKNFFLRPSS